MGCCIAVAFVIALVRKGWFALFPGRAPVEVLFAPTAFRPGPGVRAEVGAAAPVAPRRTGSQASMLLGAAAVTVALYAGVVAVLRWTGLAEGMSMPSAIGWTTRDLIFGAGGVLAVLLAAVLYRGPVEPRASRAAVLVGAGATWTVLAVLDMHAFGLLEVGHGSLAGDVVFHGAGLLALVIGLTTMLTRGPAPAASTSRRPEPILR